MILLAAILVALALLVAVLLVLVLWPPPPPVRPDRDELRARRQLRVRTGQVDRVDP